MSSRVLEVKGGDGLSAHQADWCNRKALHRTSRAPQAAASNGSQSNGLRRRLLLLRQPRSATQPARKVSTTSSSENNGRYTSQDPRAEISSYQWWPSQTSEQHRSNREAMLRQYQTWNGIDIKKMDLPLYPEPHSRPKSNRPFGQSKSWMVDDQALRQLSNPARRGLPVSQYGFPVQPWVAASTCFESNKYAAALEWRRTHGKQRVVIRRTDAPAFAGSAPAARSAAATANSQPKTPSKERPLSGVKSAPAAQNPRQDSVTALVKSVRFSDELTVHEAPSEPRCRPLPRTRAMTAVLLSQRISAFAGDGRRDYIDKLRQKSNRQFLQALDKVIARLKRTKLPGQNALLTRKS